MLGHIALEQVTDYTVRGLICNKTVKLFIQDCDIFILHVATLHYTYAHLAYSYIVITREFPELELH